MIAAGILLVGLLASAAWAPETRALALSQAGATEAGEPMARTSTTMAKES